MGENGLRLSPSHIHSSPQATQHPPSSHHPPHSIVNGAFPSSSEYYPPPSHPPPQAPGLISIPESSQLLFATGTGLTPEQDIEIAQAQVASRTGLNPAPPIPHPASTPPGESSARKRCASEIDVERPVKALKAEPQDDLLYNSTQPLHIHTLQSPPPSRPPTPSSAQAGFVFTPIKTPPHSQPTPYPPSSASSSISSPHSIHSQNLAAASAPDLAKVTSPVFPPLRSAWSESVVPTIGGQSRHSHSLSTGSITTPSSSGATTGASSPVSHTNASSSTSATSTAHPSPPRFSAGVNGRINGRMTRSGSIGTLGSHPFTYSYPQSVWSDNVAKRGDAATGSFASSCAP